MLQAQVMTPSSYACLSIAFWTHHTWCLSPAVVILLAIVCSLILYMNNYVARMLETAFKCGPRVANISPVMQRTIVDMAPPSQSYCMRLYVHHVHDMDSCLDFKAVCLPAQMLLRRAAGGGATMWRSSLLEWLRQSCSAPLVPSQATGCLLTSHTCGPFGHA